VLAPAVAALSGAGVVALWRAQRLGGAAAWLLPEVVIAEIAWSAHLSARYSHFVSWLTPLVVAVGGVSAALLLAGWLSHRIGRRLLTGALIAAVVAVVATPTVWAASVVDSAYGGTAFDAGAGPSASKVADAGPKVPVWAQYVYPKFTSSSIVPYGGLGFDSLIADTTSLNSAQQRLTSYLRAHQDGARYLFATDTWATGGPFVMGGVENVIVLNGFNGGVAQFDLTALRHLVETGQLRYFLINGLGFLGGFPVGAATSGAQQQTAHWITTNCAAVPAANYESAATAATPGSPKLYACGQ
jgi:hypothetical protein